VRYREALAALDQYCKNEKGGAFASLSDADKGAIIGALESGAAKLDGVDGQAFFELLLRNVRGDFSPIRFMAAIAICAPGEALGWSAPHAPDEQERPASEQLAPVKPQAPWSRESKSTSGLASCCRNSGGGAPYHAGAIGALVFLSASMNSWFRSRCTLTSSGGVNASH
jgi:Gluconate 2-dehydrogenase subunit 3